jgi:hypothetical protein
MRVATDGAVSAAEARYIQLGVSSDSSRQSHSSRENCPNIGAEVDSVEARYLSV